MKKLFSKTVSAILVLFLFAGLLPVSALAAAPGSTAGQVSVSGSLNIRSSASTASSILGSLANGSYITLLSKSGDWWRVEYGNGQFGYCHSGYIKEIPGSYAACASTNLNVRSGPGTSYDVISWLNNGQYVVVLSTSGEWKRILFSGTRTGYVKASYLSAESSGYSSVSLNVPDYKQTDPRWAYVEVGSSGQNIKTIGCATTSLAMSESYRTGTTIYPDQMEAKLKYTSGGSVYWPSNYSAYTGSDYLSTAYNLLRSGKPVLIGVKNSYGSQHWVVITGFAGGSSLSASSFTINDPATASRTTLQQLMSVYPIFYKLMHY